MTELEKLIDALEYAKRMEMEDVLISQKDIDLILNLYEESKSNAIIIDKLKTYIYQIHSEIQNEQSEEIAGD